MEDDDCGSRKIYVYDHKRSIPPKIFIANDDDDEEEEESEVEYEVIDVEPETPDNILPSPRLTPPAAPKIGHLLTSTEITIPSASGPAKILPPPPPKISHLLTGTSTKGNVTIQAQTISKEKDNKDDSKSSSRGDYRSRSSHRSRSRSPFKKYGKRGRNRNRSRNKERGRGRNIFQRSSSSSSSSGSDDAKYYINLIKRSKILASSTLTTSTSSDKEKELKKKPPLSSLYDIYTQNNNTNGSVEPAGDQISRNQDLPNPNLPPPMPLLQNNPNQSQFLDQQMNPYQNSWRHPHPPQNQIPPPWANNFNPQLTNYIYPPRPLLNPNNLNLRPMMNNNMPFQQQARPMYIQRNYYNINNTMNFVQNCPPPSIPIHRPQYQFLNQQQQQPRFYYTNQNGSPIPILPRFLPPQLAIEPIAHEPNDNNDNKIKSDTVDPSAIIEIDPEPSLADVHSSSSSNNNEKGHENEKVVYQNQQDSRLTKDNINIINQDIFIKSQDVIVQLKDLLEDKNKPEANNIEISIEGILIGNQNQSSDNSDKDNQEIVKDSTCTVEDEEDDDDIMIIEEFVRSSTSIDKSKTYENNPQNNDTHSYAKNATFLSTIPSQLSCDSVSDVIKPPQKPTAKIHPNIPRVKDKEELATVDQDHQFSSHRNRITNEKEAQKEKDTNTNLHGISTESPIMNIENELEDKESEDTTINQTTKQNEVQTDISQLITSTSITTESLRRISDSYNDSDSDSDVEDQDNEPEVEDSSINQTTKEAQKNTSSIINNNNSTESLNDIAEGSQNSNSSSSSSSSSSSDNNDSDSDSNISEAQIAVNIDSSESHQDNSLKQMCTFIYEAAANMEKEYNSLTADITTTTTSATAITSTTTSTTSNSTTTSTTTTTNNNDSMSTEAEDAIKEQDSGIEIFKNMIRKTYLTLKDFQDNEKEQELIKTDQEAKFPVLSIKEKSIYFLLLVYLYRMKEDIFLYQYHTYTISLLYDLLTRLFYHTCCSELAEDIGKSKSQLLESNLKNFLESFRRIISSDFLSFEVYDNLDILGKDFTHVLKEIKAYECDNDIETPMYLVINDVNEGIDGYISKIRNLIEALFIPQEVKVKQIKKLEAIKQVWNRLKTTEGEII